MTIRKLLVIDRSLALDPRSSRTTQSLFFDACRHAAASGLDDETLVCSIGARASAQPRSTDQVAG